MSTTRPRTRSALARGTLTEPGKNSPFRDRSVEENLDLFRRMKAGEFPNGARVLRAKIDMASGNINLRDPVLYRILHATHPRTGDKWSIYPSYDYAHGQSDAIEGITHSICTLEFEDHRPLYDWFLAKLPVPSTPHQYEFARLNLTYTLLSKRVLTQLVRDGHVAGWDDPRMPTIAGLKRRGVPPAAIREFVKRIGVAKANSVVDVGMLEFCIREELNRTAQRRMAVLRPLKVVIENYPEGQIEEIEAINHPDDPAAGTRRIAFGRELYIERDDFMENPPKKFFRLSPGTEVRLRYAYFIKCTGVIKNASGEVVELRCTYDPATKGGNAPDGRKVKATMHWLPAAQSKPGRNPHLQPAVCKALAGRRQFRRRPQSAVAGNPEGRPDRGPRRGKPIRTRSCSSNGRAISCATRTRRRTVRCSTAPSACAIPLRRKSAAEGLRPMASAADETVSGIIGKWSAAFNRLDAATLASLYSKNVFFFGSKSQLYRGREGVAAYFNALPRWASPTVQFTDRAIAQVNPGSDQFCRDRDLRRRGRCCAVVGQDHLGDHARGRRLENRQPSRLVADAAALERFRAKWIPVRVKKTRQNKNPRASVLIQSEPIML